MSNRLLFVFTLVVVLAMLLLFAIRAIPFLWKDPLTSFLKAEEVRGMELVYQGKPFTLSFKQQNRMIELLNQSVPIAPQKYPSQQNQDFDRLIIYRFGSSNLILTPEIYVDEDLAYRVPEWNQNGLLMDISGGTLKQLIYQIHEP